MRGGSGRNGGSGGRLGVVYNFTNYEGSYHSEGGEGSHGESGAAATVFTKDTGLGGQKKIRIYNKKGKGVTTLQTHIIIEWLHLHIHQRPNLI